MAVIEYDAQGWAHNESGKRIAETADATRRRIRSSTSAGCVPASADSSADAYPDTASSISSSSLTKDLSYTLARSGDAVVRCFCCAFLVAVAGVSWAEPNAAVVEKTDEFTDRHTLRLDILSDTSGRGPVGMSVLCGDDRQPSVWFAGADVPRRDIETVSHRSGPGLFSDADEANEFGVYSDTEKFGAFPYDDEMYVDMTYRFDKWKADRMRVGWYADDRYVYFNGWRRTTDWMALLEASDTLIVKFGRGRVDRYDLSAARAAIRDFKTRCRPVGRLETNGRITLGEAE